jgi:ABC-type transporter Mla subunit MlaD
VEHRTFLQEAFVNIAPGRTGGAALRSGTVVPSVPTVEADDALQVFDPETRRLLDRGTSSLARGLRAENAAEQLSGTIGGLDGVLAGIRGITGALRGQAGSIASLVNASATVLDAIAAEQSQLAQLIGSGRVVADTFAGQQRALASGIDQLNGVLALTQALLPRLRPLAAGATPVLGELTATADAVRPALTALAPAVADLRATSLALDPSARAATPALTATLHAAAALIPLAHRLVPTIADLVPLMGYIRSQLGGFEAFIGNLAASVDHGDRTGPYLQAFLDVTTGGVAGGDGGCRQVSGLCTNPYPKPGDASDPQPLAPGGFPRLKPYFAH